MSPIKMYESKKLHPSQKRTIRIAHPRFKRDEFWICGADIVSLVGADKSKTSRYTERLPQSLVQKVKTEDPSGTPQDTLWVHQAAAVMLIGQLTKGDHPHEFCRMLVSGRMQEKEGRGFAGDDYEVRPVTVSDLQPYTSQEEIEWAEKYADRTDIIQLRDGTWAKRIHGKRVGDVRIIPIDQMLQDKIKEFMGLHVWGIKVDAYPVTPDGKPHVYEQAEALWNYVEQCKAEKRKPTAMYLEDMDRVAYKTKDGTVRDLDTGEILVPGKGETEDDTEAARMAPVSEGFTPGISVKFSGE